jgi:hypothetical protein
MNKLFKMLLRKTSDGTEEEDVLKSADLTCWVQNASDLFEQGKSYNDIISDLQTKGVSPSDIAIVMDLFQQLVGDEGIVKSNVEKIIRHEGNEWVLYSHEGKVLGRHPTKESAERQEEAVQANKSQVQKDLKYDEWEEKVIEEVAKLFDAPISDAQGVVMIQPFILQREWANDTDPKKVAQIIERASTIHRSQDETSTEQDIVDYLDKSFSDDSVITVAVVKEKILKAFPEIKSDWSAGVLASLWIDRQRLKKSFPSLSSNVTNKSFSHPTAEGKRLMNIDNDIWNKFGFRSGGDVDKNWDKYKQAVNEKVQGKVSKETWEDLQDNNYHSMIRALNELGKLEKSQIQKGSLSYGLEREIKLEAENNFGPYSTRREVENNVKSAIRYMLNWVVREEDEIKELKEVLNNPSKIKEIVDSICEDSEITKTEKSQVEKARTIGAHWKEEIKRIMAQGKKQGIENIDQMKDFVYDKLPQEAFDTWESAYSEIGNLVRDYWDSIPDPRPSYMKAQGTFDSDIKEEEEGSKHYKDLANKYPEFSSEFNEMAQQELGHKKKLEEMKDKLDTTEKATMYTGYKCKLCGEEFFPYSDGKLASHLKNKHPQQYKELEDAQDNGIDLMLWDFFTKFKRLLKSQVLKSIDDFINKYETIQKPGASAIHSKKWDKCVEHVKASGSGKNAYAICTAALGDDSFKSMSDTLTDEDIKIIDEMNKKK